MKKLKSNLLKPVPMEVSFRLRKFASNVGCGSFIVVLISTKRV